MKDMDLSNYDYPETRVLFTKYFSLGNLGISFENKLALIGMICYLTNQINKNKDELNKVNCYQVICKIGKNLSDSYHNSYFKALGAICDDLMYNCTEFPNFGIETKAMPKEVLKLLNEWLPF